MKKISGLLILVLVVSSLFAFQRAAMEPPVVRGTEDQVAMTARFSGFVADGEYRLGFGVDGTYPSAAKIELTRDGEPVSWEFSDFSQGFTSSWWGVDKLTSKGVVLSGDQVPREGQNVTMRVSLPRDAADSLGKLYVFIAKKYGPNWYLEDGAELTREHW